MKGTRIYLGITGTGGMVRGSYEVGNIYEILYYGNDYKRVLEHIRFSKTKDISHDLFIDDEDYAGLQRQGYDGEVPKYAIEIKDFREEDYELANDYERLNAHAHGCNDYIVGYGDEEGCDTKIIKRLPQSFQYICKPYMAPTKAILMPTHQKWFDMIKSGDKVLEFRRTLPIAMRGER